METAQQYEIENWHKALNIPYDPLLGASQSYFLALNKIKEWYLEHMDEIIRCNKLNKNILYSTPFDWGMLLNPIEYETLCIIKNKGYMPLYPQFPVFNRFIDFGNPALKIGIEIDGKDFHDKRKDEMRDDKLNKVTGWTIIRIPASEIINNSKSGDFCNNCIDGTKCFNDCKNNVGTWLCSTGDGVLESIKVIYFNGRICAPDALKNWYYQVSKDSVRMHNSTK